MNFKKDTTIVVGDLHGNWDFLIWKMKTQNITNATFIQVGDFGVGFKNEKTEEESLRKLNIALTNNKCWLIVLRGNHDDPDYFKGEKKYRFLNRIEFIPDYTIMNNEFMFVGGAVSIDRSERILDLKKTPYFGSEGVQKSLTFMEKTNNSNITKLFLHAAPLSVYREMCRIDVSFNLKTQKAKYYATDYMLENDLRQEQILLEEICLKLPNLKEIYFGHYHKNIRGTIQINGNDVKFFMLGISVLLTL